MKKKRNDFAAKIVKEYQLNLGTSKPIPVSILRSEYEVISYNDMKVGDVIFEKGNKTKSVYLVLSEKAQEPVGFLIYMSDSSYKHGTYSFNKCYKFVG